MPKIDPFPERFYLERAAIEASHLYAAVDAARRAALIAGAEDTYLADLEVVREVIGDVRGWIQVVVRSGRAAAVLPMVFPSGPDPDAVRPDQVSPDGGNP